MTTQEKVREIFKKACAQSGGIAYKALLDEALQQIQAVYNREKAIKIDTVYGYKLHQLRQIIDFAASQDFKPKNIRGEK